jgi:hypothetical protein
MLHAALLASMRASTDKAMTTNMKAIATAAA